MRTSRGTTNGSLPLLAGLAIAVLLLTGLVARGTYALFSDTESSSGNTFTAGTLDLAVDGENPWSSTLDVDLADFQPGMVRTASVALRNSGTLSFDLWMRITDVTTGGGISVYPPEDPVASSEAEYSAEGGPTSWAPIDDLDTVIYFYMDEVGDADSIPADTYRVSQLEDKYIYLGVMPPDTTWNMTQYYKMPAGTGNEYQGDTMDFTIQFFAQQSGGDPQPPIPGTQLAGYERP